MDTQIIVENIAKRNFSRASHEAAVSFQNDIPERFFKQAYPLLQANCFNFFFTNYLYLEVEAMIDILQPTMIAWTKEFVKAAIAAEKEANAPISRKEFEINNYDRLID